MNKNYIIPIMVGLSLLAFIGFGLFFAPKPEKLCIYEIPNEITFKCPAGNETKNVVNFQTTLFAYDNALDVNCTIFSNNTDIKSFRYEVNNCGLELPFRRIK